MILLDTNVVSEPLRPAGDVNALAWLGRQDNEALYLSAISLAQLRYGAARMAEGRRKSALIAALEDRIVPAFGHRILPFDVAAATAFARLALTARQSGKAATAPDIYIAAIAAAHGFAVATRDTAPFDAAGVPVINPWTAP